MPFEKAAPSYREMPAHNEKRRFEGSGAFSDQAW